MSSGDLQQCDELCCADSLKSYLLSVEEVDNVIRTHLKHVLQSSYSGMAPVVDFLTSCLSMAMYQTSLVMASLFQL